MSADIGRSGTIISDPDGSIRTNPPLGTDNEGERALADADVMVAMREQARKAHAIAVEHLATARQQRDALNKRITRLVAEEAELRRVVAALTRGKRTRAKKAST